MRSFSDNIYASNDYNELNDVELVFTDVNTPIKAFDNDLVTLLKTCVRGLKCYVDMQPLRNTITGLMENIFVGTAPSATDASEEKWSTFSRPMA